PAPPRERGARAPGMRARPPAPPCCGARRAAELRRPQGQGRRLPARWPGVVSGDFAGQSSARPRALAPAWPGRAPGPARVSGAGSALGATGTWTLRLGRPRSGGAAAEPTVPTRTTRSPREARGRPGTGSHARRAVRPGARGRVGRSRPAPPAPRSEGPDPEAARRGLALGAVARRSKPPPGEPLAGWRHPRTRTASTATESAPAAVSPRSHGRAPGAPPRCRLEPRLPGCLARAGLRGGNRAHTAPPTTPRAAGPK